MMFSCFPFGFEGRMWDLIVSGPDHCLSFYLITIVTASITCSASDALGVIKRENRFYYEWVRTITLDYFSVNEMIHEIVYLPEETVALCF